MLGEALERRTGGCLCYGPPIEEGFYYDIALPQNGTITKEDYPLLEQIMERILEDKQPFERLLLHKKDLMEMFRVRRLDGVAAGAAGVPSRSI